MLNYIETFVKESNAIEGITTVREEEIDEAYRFLELPKLSIRELENFVNVYQPNAELRDVQGLNVIVGKHIPPAGGVFIHTRLEDILNDANSGKFTAYEIHQQYEQLHPFTDCNGRSGRMIWAWMMYRIGTLGRSFLHEWYYQSLDGWRK